MKTEFSQTLAWRTIIVCSLIQLLMSMMNLMIMAHSFNQSSWVYQFY
ncbi:hypothetical protein [Turicibacter sp. TJ11]|nr:hypothetical protein [Turicibacter sp. TJ11]